MNPWLKINIHFQSLNTNTDYILSCLDSFPPGQSQPCQTVMLTLHLFSASCSFSLERLPKDILCSLSNCLGLCHKTQWQVFRYNSVKGLMCCNLITVCVTSSNGWYIIMLIKPLYYTNLAEWFAMLCLAFCINISTI